MEPDYGGESVERQTHLLFTDGFRIAQESVSVVVIERFKRFEGLNGEVAVTDVQPGVAHVIDDVAAGRAFREFLKVLRGIRDRITILF